MASPTSSSPPRPATASAPGRWARCGSTAPTRVPKRSERYPDGHPIAIEGMRLVLATLRLIAVLQPRYWVIENPRGRLRSLDLLAGIPRHDRLVLPARARPRQADRPLGRLPRRARPAARVPQRQPRPRRRAHGAAGPGRRVASAPRRPGGSHVSCPSGSGSPWSRRGLERASSHPHYPSIVRVAHPHRPATRPPPRPRG